MHTNFFCIFFEKHVPCVTSCHIIVQEKALLFENEEMQIPLEVPDIENNLVKI